MKGNLNKLFFDRNGAVIFVLNRALDPHINININILTEYLMVTNPHKDIRISIFQNYHYCRLLTHLYKSIFPYSIS